MNCPKCSENINISKEIETGIKFENERKKILNNREKLTKY